MTTAAVVAQAQQYSYLQLAFIIVLGSLAKTIAAVIVYVIVDKAEDVIIGKYGKWIGISHTQVEKIGKILTNSWYDDVLLFIARALPVVPSTLVSVAAGAIKYDMRSYVITTFLGNCIRSAFYLWIGYIGWEAAEAVWQHIQGNPIFIGIAVLAVMGLVYIAMKIKDQLWDQLFSSATKKAD